MVSAPTRVSLLVLAALCAHSGLAVAQSDDQPADQGAVPSGISGAVVKPAAPAKEPAKKPVIMLPKLTVDREGNVTKADVPEPVGSGFDEAAKAAALKFKFKPATRDGVPIPVVIPYRYSFTLTVKPSAEPPPPPPTTGNLLGTVRLAESNAALAGAAVIITLADGSQRQVLTDETGKWRIDGLPAGKYKVRIESPGFQPLENLEEVGLGEETEATYRLAPVSEGIEITVQGERPPREVTRRTIERREIDRIPGT